MRVILQVTIGVGKTLEMFGKISYWPSIKRDVSRFSQRCHTCQMIGKLNQAFPVVPVISIPTSETVLVDIVMPFPRTSSAYWYIIIVIDMATRFPEAVALRKIAAKNIVETFLKMFTLFAIPKEFQSD